MATETSFQELMTRLRSGDQGAAADLFARFARQLIAVARRRLTPSIGTKEDPEDVVQSVFRTFFRRHGEGDLLLENWGSLWNLLTVITLRKCGHRIDYFYADRRSIARETAPGDEITSWQAIAREPTPAEAAMLTETVELLLKDLEPRRRLMVELALQGEAVPAIAAQADCSERTVERVLQRVRTQLEGLRDENAPG